MDLDAMMKEVLDQLPQVIIAELGEERALELVQSDPERLSDAVRRIIVEATDESTVVLAAQLKKDGPAMLARRRAERRSFEERLHQLWADPFDLAEMTTVVAFELGEAFHEKHWPQAQVDNDLIFSVLVRLHARACRIAEEVLVLLKAGFGQAALARWRVLHEVSVIASFIADHDQDTAQRYLLHENVESWRGMKELTAVAHRLDADPYSDDEINAAKEVVDQLVSLYGKRYADPYGWAHHAIAGTDKKRRLMFGDIEKTVRLDHLRPYYRLASHGIHANPKGILYSPDTLESEPEVLLAGPASTGLADPGQCTLISLTQVTTTLLNHKTGEAAPITLGTLLSLSRDAGQAFVDTQRIVETADAPAPKRRPVTRVRHRVAPSLAVARVRARQMLASIRFTGDS